MAVLWPRKLPAEVLSNSLRAAEVKVYDRLASTLDDDFHVFYSRPWHGLTKTGREIDGECDFVIAHRDLGLLTIEVKGGGIAHFPETGKWQSTDANGFRCEIEDPVSQAMKSKYELLRKLRRSTEWAPRYIRANHGVIFPQAEIPMEALGADRPRRIFCSRDEFRSDLRGWVSQRMHEQDPLSEESPLGDDGIAALTDLLAKPFQLHFRLGHQIEDVVGDIDALTPTQFHVIKNIIADAPRLAIRGGAGTGKTIVAMEDALRLSSGGSRTLLTCHSRPLAVEMKRQLGAVDGLQVETFHEFCRGTSVEAGLGAGNDQDPRYFEEVLPQLLIEAMARRPDLRLDAIVVDEAQDFRPMWWRALDASLAPHQRSRLHAFLDANQRVYGSATEAPHDLGIVPIRLTQNLRNTQTIHNYALKHYAGFDLVAVGPKGLPAEWHEVASEAAGVHAIVSRVGRMIRQEAIRTGDIAVLSADAASAGQIAAALGRAGISACSADRRRSDQLTVDTVRRFKGLEAPVVLVHATPDLCTSELAYVALSRPRAHLVVVGSRSSLSFLREALPAQA